MKSQAQQHHQSINEMEELREAQQIHQLILDNTHDLIAIHRLADLSYEYVNPATLKLLGYSKEELLATSALELIHPDDLPAVLEVLKVNLPKGEGQAVFRYRKKDGAYVWLEVTGTILPRMNEDAAIIIVSRDVTERKQIEKDLRLSELQYRMVVEDQTELVSRCDPNMTITFANQAFCHAFGKKEDELIGHLFLDLVPEEQHKKIGSFFTELTAENPVGRFIYPHTDFGGNLCWLEWTTRAIFDERGDLVEYQGVARDITEHKNLETALKKTHDELETKVQERTAELVNINQALQNEIEQRQRVEESLRKESQFTTAILNSSGALIKTATPDGKIVAFNKACEQASGYSAAEVIGKYPWEFLLDEDDMVIVKGRYAQLAAGLESNGGVNYWTTKDGHRRLINWTNTALRAGNGEPEYFVSTGIDITEQYEAEAALRKSEAYYRTIFENTGTATVIVDKDLKMTMANSRFIDMSGYPLEEIVGRSPFEFAVPEDLAIIQENHRLRKLDPSQAPPSYEVRVVNKHGEIRNCILYVAVVPGSEDLVISTLDVTEQRQAETQLIASEERFRNLVEKAPVGITINRDGRTLFANQGFVEMHGYETSSELIGSPVINQVTPNCRREMKKRMKNLETEGAQTQRHELMGLRKDGSTFPAFVQVNNIDLPDGPANIAFITDVTEQKQAEVVRLRHIESQELLLEISKKFTSTVADEIDQLINTTLKMIGEFDSDDRSYLFMLADDGSTISNTHEWCAEGIQPEIANLQNLPVEILPWWMDKLRRLEIINISCVADMPAEAAAEKEILQAQAIQSLLVVPIINEDKLIGFLGFDAVKHQKTWSQENINILDLVAQVFAKAVRRKKNITALRESESYYRTIFENTGAATIIIEEDMTISRANQEWERVLGYKKEELVGIKWTELVGRDMLSVMQEYHRQRRIDPELVPSPYITRIYDHLGKSRDGLVYVEIISGTTKSVATFIDLTDYQRIDRTLKGICAGNGTMIQADNEQELLEGICQKIVEVGGYSLAWVGYLQDDDMKKVKPVAHDGNHHGYLHKLNIALKDPKRGLGPVARAIFTGKPVVLKEFKTDETFTPWAKDALRRGFKSTMAIPLTADNKAFGALSIYADSTDAFEKEEQQMLTEMANNLAYAILSLRTRAAKNQATEELHTSLEKLQRILLQSVASLGTTVEIRDPYTAGHQIRVTQLASAIAREMGLPPEQIEGIVVAGNLHDIGKINVPSEILSKPGKINAMEFGIIKTHCQSGYEIVKDIEFPWPIGEVLLQHHERMDGSGYPHGLTGEEILPEARIMAVADVVEAMASHRPYRPALGIEVALEEISHNSGILYDPQVVQACLKLFRKKGFQFE